jgi:hypothetical protein
VLFDKEGESKFVLMKRLTRNGFNVKASDWKKTVIKSDPERKKLIINDHFDKLISEDEINE